QDGTVTIERAITTNQTDDNGTADNRWLNIMVPKTVTAVRYDFNTYIEQTYPRAKLAPDNSLLANSSSANVATPKVLTNSWNGRSALYEGTQGWLENTATLGKQAFFQINASDRNRADGFLPIQVIGALIVVATSIQLES
ncbi:hypothetical protein HK28_02320, partial [Acetobacter sp. DsW_063]